MKKILSMLLSATLICSFVCPAFATSRTDKQMSPMNEKYRTAVYEQIALSTDTASAERADPLRILRRDLFVQRRVLRDHDAELSGNR